MASSKKRMQWRLFYDYCAKGLMRVETSRQEFEKMRKAALRDRYYFYIANKTNEERNHFPLTQSCIALPINGLAPPMPLLSYSMSEEQWSEGKDNQYERNRWSPLSTVWSTDRLRLRRESEKPYCKTRAYAESTRSIERRCPEVACSAPAQYCPNIIQFWRHNGRL